MKIKTDEEPVREHNCCLMSDYGMHRGEILLGRAYNGCGVWYWPDYGVTCPCLVTTNGSLLVLMRSWGVPTSFTPEGSAFFIGRALYTAARRCLWWRG